MKKIALEEHFTRPEMAAYARYAGSDRGSPVFERFQERLLDFGEMRLEAMDSAGIDLAVLSVTTPGVQAEPDAEVAIKRARIENDFLAREITRHPTRYAGFAHLPLQDATAAADELFNPVGTAKFTSSCDIAKSALVARSVNYQNETAPAGTKASVKVGDRTISTTTPDFAKQLGDAITKGGYPASADPADINYVMTIVLLTILVIYVTMVYAPIAAWLVELFPARIRYSGLSLPYHIGNGWFGGFLPATVFAIVAATGNIYSGLWYPIGVAAMSLVLGLIFLPETKDRSISHNA